MRKKLATSVTIVVIVALAFAAGWTTSLYAKKYGARLGMVNALDAVGQNLFGRGKFGASVVAVNDADGTPAARVQIDIPGDQESYPTIPNRPFRNRPIALVNLFDAQTCRTFAQMQVGPLGPRIVVDPEATPTGDAPLVEYDVGLSKEFPPGPCHPPDPVLPPDV